MMTTTTHSRYSHDDLEQAFSVIQDKEDWRAPIETWIRAKDFDLAAEACVYFTATNLSILDFRDGMVLVSAAGYRAGPAGDH